MEEEFSIVKNTQMPKPHGGLRNLFRVLVIGDRIVLPNETKFRDACRVYATRQKIKVTVRKVGDQLHCWRIK